MKKTKYLSFVLLLILVISLFYFNLISLNNEKSTSFYISNEGDDLNSGLSSDVPWQTLKKLNYELKRRYIPKGSDIFFKRGDVFTDTDLNLRVGGNESNKMVIGAYGIGNKPLFEKVSIIAVESSMGHLIVKDLEIAPKDGKNGITFNEDNLSEIGIINCKVHGSSNNGIYLSRINGYNIENCEVYDCANSGIVIQGSDEYKITNGEIKNCTVYNIDSNDGINIHYDGNKNPVGLNHLVVNCCGYNCGEEAIDLSAAENVYIKDCEGYNNGVASVVIGHGSKNITIDGFYSHDEKKMSFLITQASNVVVRNSIAYNSSHYLVNIYGKDENNISENINFYNNVFVYSNKSNFIFLSKYIYLLNFKNNIFTSTEDLCPNRLLMIADGGNTTNRNIFCSNNIWWKEDGEATEDRWWYIDEPASNLNWEQWKSLEEVSNEIRIDPKLISIALEDFRTEEDSPAKNGGCWLTATKGSGTGYIIPVFNAGYFSDGFGLIQGDKILVGHYFTTIVDVDYENNVISVNSEIKWEAEEKVTLMYGDLAPDIGLLDKIDV